MEKFKMRLGKYEVRPILDNDKDEFELVHWCRNNSSEEYCYVIAFFELTDEGYDMTTVGDRLAKVEPEDRELVFQLISIAHPILDSLFHEEQKNFFD